MVTHMVLLRVRKDVDARTIERVMSQVGALQGRIPGILAYSWGAYASPEGLHRGYTHGFCMTFRDTVARDAYLPHPEHEQVKAALLAILDGGIDGVLAFDYGA
jgi:hypothetical protein